MLVKADTPRVNIKHLNPPGVFRPWDPKSGPGTTPTEKCFYLFTASRQGGFGLRIATKEVFLVTIELGAMPFHFGPILVWLVAKRWHRVPDGIHMEDGPRTQGSEV